MHFTKQILMKARTKIIQLFFLGALVSVFGYAVWRVYFKSFREYSNFSHDINDKFWLPDHVRNKSYSEEELYYEIKVIDRLYALLNLWIHYQNPKMDPSKNIFTWRWQWKDEWRSEYGATFFGKEDFYANAVKMVLDEEAYLYVYCYADSDDIDFWGEEFFPILQREIWHALFCCFSGIEGETCRFDPVKPCGYGELFGNEGCSSWKDLCPSELFFRITERVLLKTSFWQTTASPMGVDCQREEY